MVGQGCEAGRPKAVSVRTRRGVARTQAVSAITLALVKHIQIGLLSVCLSVCLSVWLAGWLAGPFVSDAVARMAGPGILLATGTEDYFDDAYTFESVLDERPTQHTFYEEDAGLSHASLAGGGRRAGGLSSMFRLHHQDPLYFRGKLELVWRDGGMTRPSDHTRKCLLRSGGEGDGASVDLTVDSWLYTWEQPS
jgi:hypothetical protein